MSFYVVESLQDGIKALSHYCHSLLLLCYLTQLCLHPPFPNHHPQTSNPPFPSPMYQLSIALPSLTTPRKPLSKDSRIDKPTASHS